MTAAAALVLAALPAVDELPDPHAWRDAGVLAALADAQAHDDRHAVRALATGYDALLLRVPHRDGTALGWVDAGTGERRHRGAFSTPPRLAASLVRRVLPDPAAVPLVVDPACGAGALLRAVLARLLAAGVPAAEAAAALHGVDADPVAAALCRAVLAADLADAGHHDMAVHPAGPTVLVGDALLDPPLGVDLAAGFPGPSHSPTQSPRR